MIKLIIAMLLITIFTSMHVSSEFTNYNVLHLQILHHSHRVPLSPRGIFSSEWKKKIVIVYKNGNDKCASHYRFTYLLSVLFKVLEKLIYNATFQYLLGNGLISLNQSGTYFS